MLRELMTATGSAMRTRVRQNLALVVGLQGRFDEARKIASEDLPPDQVDANLSLFAADARPTQHLEATAGKSGLVQAQKLKASSRPIR